MVNTFQADGGGGGGFHAFLFHSIYHHVQSGVVYAPAERGDTLSLFFLYPYMYSVDLATQGKLKAAT
jgi:hypothetical protein